MHPALTHTDHRPWPLPDAPWTWRQRWCDLLFAHWNVPASWLTPLIPDPLRLDTYNGTAWLGVIPFRMEGVMRRPLPDLPWISAFPEMNVRTYVTYQGKPGVWFLSLDATNLLAVLAARLFFHLPYYWASMSLTKDAHGIQYASTRTDARFLGRYRPTGPVQPAEPDTLTHWLTERYCLYTQIRTGVLIRNEVHHPPWPLQPAECTIQMNTMPQSHGLPVTGSPDHLCFARSLDVVVWNPERIE